MSMQFLSANTDDQGIHYSIWLDTTQSITDDAGTTVPDPAYVRSYDWAPCPTDWVGGSAAYEQMTLDEVKLLAASDLASIQAAANPTPQPTPLAVQGQTF